MKVAGLTRNVTLYHTDITLHEQTFWLSSTLCTLALVIAFLIQCHVARRTRPLPRMLFGRAGRPRPDGPIILNTLKF